MNKTVSRRRLLQAAPALAVSPVIAGCGGEPEPPLPEGIPIGPFGSESTAEEVTAGIDLTGKTALVTGCNSGIGYETMRVLALRGAHVYGSGRTLKKATDACNSVDGRTTPVVIELTELDSVVAAAQSIAAETETLDIIVCNAGIMELPELEQVNGIEKQFFVNHLGHFVLVNRLLPQVVAAPQGRVVNVSSGAAIRLPPETGIEFDNLSGERDYGPGKAYGQSKLATSCSRSNWPNAFRTRRRRPTRCGPASSRPTSAGTCRNGNRGCSRISASRSQRPSPRGRQPRATSRRTRH